MSPLYWFCHLPGLSGIVPGINAVPHDDNARYFSVVILGPQDSPYAGMWLWASSAVLLFFSFYNYWQGYLWLATAEQHPCFSGGFVGVGGRYAVAPRQLLRLLTWLVAREWVLMSSVCFSP